MPRRGAVVSIAGIGKREPGSVRDAVPAHVDQLYRFALRLTRNADRARDIVHESVLRALKHESVVLDPQAWLFQIVYRTLISQCRKDERRGTSDEDAWCDEAELESLADPLPTRNLLRREPAPSRHVRFHLHFTPTSCSWLNLVERWFRNLTQQRLRRGSFHNVKELIGAIQDYSRGHNQNPRVFVWSASVERILTKIAKCKEALDALH
jgi:hypothetical protein